MQNTLQVLDQFLEEMSSTSQPGDKLPTIREFMDKFGISQTNVQRSLQRLKDQGLISSQIGRGTFFLGTDQRQQAGQLLTSTGIGEHKSTRTLIKSVLLLRRAISISRGRMLMEGLRQRLAVNGYRVVELAYSDSEHACKVLSGLPQFDACVIQSTYKTIPIELLAVLREKSKVVIVDGAALGGTDFNAVGTEWGEPLNFAVNALLEKGHRNIAYATTSAPMLATELGRRRFHYLKSLHHHSSFTEISVRELPDENYIQAVIDKIAKDLNESKKLPYTGLIIWGVEDGLGFKKTLSEMGIKIPGDLSVILLGRTDLPNEHGDFFDVFGSSVADQIEALYATLVDRLSGSNQAYGILFTPVKSRKGESIQSV